MAQSLFVLPFGKFKGQPIEDLPSSYLQWLLEQDFFCDGYPMGLRAVDQELGFREQFGHDINTDEDRNWNRRSR